MQTNSFPWNYLQKVTCGLFEWDLQDCVLSSVHIEEKSALSYTAVLQKKNVPLSQLCWWVLLLSGMDTKLLVSHLEALWVSFHTLTHIQTNYFLKLNVDIYSTHTGRAGQ